MLTRIRRGVRRRARRLKKRMTGSPARKVAKVNARQLRLLDLMLDDLESAPEIYQPTTFWRSGMAAIVAELRERGVEDFRSHRSATAYYVPTYAEMTEPAKALEELMRSLNRTEMVTRITNKQLARYDQAIVTNLDPADRAPRLAGLSESTVGKPVEQFEFDGLRYSRSFLNYLRGLVMLKREVPDLELRTVLEIGGGFGTLGEILLGGGTTGVRYINIDIPPVAFISSYYLQQVLGADRVDTYDLTRTRETLPIDSLRDATVLCAWQTPKLQGSVDLFVNFISFQEMEPDVVANYVSHVVRLSPKYVLLRNSTTGKPVKKSAAGVGVTEPVTRQLYLDSFVGYELAASDSVLFGHVTEGGLTSEVMLLRRIDA